ncbi:MAG: PQQ-dependent sugar dehydrogenase [Xanthomonadales bacterium]|nr:PQQ-dependent sugar dehydrogenase [Xanthomonadales bacterium]
MTMRAVLLCALLACAGAALAQTWASPNFRHTHAITGRAQPTQVAFAHDGRVFVAEKAGRVWMYDNLLDATPVEVADLSAVVHDFQDRGLLGLALDPRFPERPYLYVLYAFNGGLFADVPPRWPATGCANPVGNNAGCVVSGRLSRLTLRDTQVIEERVLVEDWYQQYPSHSIGSVRFGADGYLYAGGGDGASYDWADWGQRGNPSWPDQRSPTDQGGALRAQGLEVEALYSGQVWLNGTIARIDPGTGAGAPGNPLASATDATPNAKRIIAYGLRNPFRFALRPGTNEVWIGDVGWNTTEEIDVIPAIDAGATLRNFGWPCYEGGLLTSGYSARALCMTLYTNGGTGGRTPVSAPFHAYAHTSGNAISAIAFYTGERWPAEYRNALFFADTVINRMWTIKDTNGDGRPDPVASGAATLFGQSNLGIVDLVPGPAGDLFFVNINNGRITRISWDADIANRNLAPSAAIALAKGSVADGPERSIAFAAVNSVDADDPGALAFEWDLDGDGDFDDATGVTASAAYTAPTAAVRTVEVAVRATDARGARDVARMIVTVSRDLLFVDGFDPNERREMLRSR